MVQSLGTESDSNVHAEMWYYCVITMGNERGYISPECPVGISYQTMLILMLIFFTGVGMPKTLGSAVESQEPTLGKGHSSRPSEITPSKKHGELIML